MRILGIGDYGDLGDLYLRLKNRGHEVRMSIGDPRYHDVYAGLVDRVADWRQQLPWIREAGRDGIIIFETAHQGGLQDKLRQSGFQVIGGSAWGDQLEGERSFGQSAMRRVGMQTAVVRKFSDFTEAVTWIRAHPGRYVYKHNGHNLPSTHNYVGILPDGSDLIAVLMSIHRGRKIEGPPDFILMDHIEGIETGIGAYFNGRQFVGPACLDWEHKRFFSGDLGELTGEMGTVVTYEGSEQLFTQTLARMAPLLAENGYCGYINLNCIINADGIWPLEFTCRFGYPGFAILEPLHHHGWENAILALCGRADGFTVMTGYSVGVVLTTPPFPYLDCGEHDCRGMPVSWRGTLDALEWSHVHLGEMGIDDDQLVITGPSGYILVVTGSGPDAESARRMAYALIARAVVPNGRYRIDIGEQFESRIAHELIRLGYLPGTTGA